MIKLIIIGAVILGAILAGCAGIKLKDPDKTTILIVKTAARRLAYEAAKKYPEIVSKGLVAMEELEGVTTDNLPELFANALGEVLKDVADDPLIAQELSDLGDLLEVNADLDQPIVKYAAAAIQGFHEGLSLAQSGAKLPVEEVK